MPFTASGIRKALGWAVVGLGLLTNRWTLEPLVAPDGRIEGALPIIVISTVAAALILVGLWLALRSPERLRADLTNAAVTLVTLVICFVAAEGYLRFAIAREQAPSLALFTPPDAVGEPYRLRRNLRMSSRIGDVDVRIRTNRHGMHWREVEASNGSGKTRIAFVGDSFTFGCWTDSVENSFVGVFETAIDTARYEVLNFGVPGYGMSDVAVQLREEILAFDPDYVFVMFYNGNDIRDSYLGTSKYVIIDGTARWDTTVVERLIPRELRSDHPGGPWSGLGRRLAISIFRLQVYQLASGAINLMRAEKDFTVTHNMNDYPFWSRTEYSEIALRALARTNERLDEIARITAEADAQLVIATVPFREQVYARRVVGDGYDIRFPQRHIERFAVDRRIPYLDLLPPLREASAASSDTPLYWKFDVHLTPAGHQRVGETLASYFRQREALSLRPSH